MDFDKVICGMLWIVDLSNAAPGMSRYDRVLVELQPKSHEILFRIASWVSRYVPEHEKGSLGMERVQPGRVRRAENDRLPRCHLPHRNGSFKTSTLTSSSCSALKVDRWCRCA